MTDKLAIRAVQLDLARQMETLDFIKKYITFAAQNGFNAIFLYLEWRIRCNTVDIGEGKGYTKDELKELVAYGSEHNIEIIPGLAGLGHSELLLSHEKFAHLAELYPDLKGRFNVHNCNDLCPSHPEVRKLLESYFTEAAEIFPSSYIHAGGDEVWDMKFCPRCRERQESAAEIFAEHFIFCNSIISGKLKKRMMIWDDMFEFYPSILSVMPRDIIMVNWQYQENVTAYQGHFSNFKFCDLLKTYDKLGFDYIFAPADYTWSNIESITRYNDNAKPLGGLLTTWEKAQTLLYHSMPNIALAGRLWSRSSNNSSGAFRDIAKEVFGIEDKTFSDALQGTQNSIYRMQQQITLSEGNLLTHAFTGLDSFLLPAVKLQRNTLGAYIHRTKDEFSELILEDLLDNLDLKILKLETIQHFFDIINYKKFENPAKLLEKLFNIKEKQLAKCRKYRRPGDEKRMETLFINWENAVRNTWNKLQNSTQLKVLFFLNDTHGAQRTTIYAKINGEYQQIANGCFKCGTNNLFYRTFLLSEDMKFDTVKIESSGFGGQGLCYMSLDCGNEKYIPLEVISTDGEIINHQYIINNDATVCFMGHNRILDIFDDHEACNKKHTLEIKMQKI